MIGKVCTSKKLQVILALNNYETAANKQFRTVFQSFD